MFTDHFNIIWLTIGWLRSTVEERRLFPGELSCRVLDLQLTSDYLYG